jgi:hypothetical protein
LNLRYTHKMRKSSLNYRSTSDSYDRTAVIGNDLRRLHADNKYTGGSGRFWEKYDSIIVVPIQDHKRENATVYGFLAADCLASAGQEVFNFQAHFYILAAAADTIASYGKIADSFFPMLFIDALAQ